jgi:protein involved in ribonucleotide reduction
MVASLGAPYPAKVSGLSPVNRRGEVLGIVYFSSASGNTDRFVAKLGLAAQRIPLHQARPAAVPRLDAQPVFAQPSPVAPGAPGGPSACVMPTAHESLCARQPGDPGLVVDKPYVLIVPTYGGGSKERGTVPMHVVRFLNHAANRVWLRGVIAVGNTNFGTAYGLAGDIIAAKCQVPCLAKFELMGTPGDVERIRDGLIDWWGKQ